MGGHGAGAGTIVCPCGLGDARRQRTTRARRATPARTICDTHETLNHKAVWVLSLHKAVWVLSLVCEHVPLSVAKEALGKVRSIPIIT